MDNVLERLNRTDSGGYKPPLQAPSDLSRYGVGRFPHTGIHNGRFTMEYYVLVIKIGELLLKAQS